LSLSHPHIREAVWISGCDEPNIGNTYRWKQTRPIKNALMGVSNVAAPGITVQGAAKLVENLIF